MWAALSFPGGNASDAEIALNGADTAHHGVEIADRMFTVSARIRSTCLGGGSLGIQCLVTSV